MMAEFQNTIDLFGDDVVANMIVERTINEYNDNVITTIGNYAFGTCQALTSVNLPNVTSVGQSVFVSCDALSSVNLPKLTKTSMNMFSYCIALTSIDLSNLAIIEASSFKNCQTLTTLILRSSTSCYLQNINAFTGTPFASGGSGGTVYVPQALIEQYQTATNWSSLYSSGKCNFVAIEGSEYE